MMKIIIISASICCLTVSAVSQTCKDDFAKFTKEYINKADGIVHEHTVDLDLDGMEDCINDAARGCGQSVSKELGADYQDVPSDTLEQCADDSMGSAQDKIQNCVKSEFPDVSFGTKQEQKDSPGLRLVVLLGTLKQSYKTCRDVTKCIPQNYKDIKSALCKAKTEIFGDFDRRCGGTEQEVQKTTCKCYKSVPNKDGIVKDFNACCGVEESRSFVSRLGSRVAQGGILKKIEKSVCSDDYQSKYGVCEDDELEKAQKTTNTLSRLSSLVNGGGRGGSQGGGGGGSFGSRFSSLFG